MSEPDRFEGAAGEAFLKAYDSARKAETAAFVPYAAVLLLAAWILCLGLLSIASAIRETSKREGAA